MDFYAPSAKLVIKIDRGQHFEKAHMQNDIREETHLEILGLKVLRLNNFQVLQSIDAVLDLIYDEIPSS